MVDKNGASFLYRKRGVYYFSKQVSCDIKAHYSRQRVVICLMTKSKLIRLGIANQIECFLAKLFGDLSGKIQKSSEASRGTKLERNGGMAP